MGDELEATCLSLITPFQISAGDLAEVARPALFAAAALASAWVFHDARRREGMGRAPVCAWALLTFLFPPAVLPLYLAARLYTRRAAEERDDSGDSAAPEADAAGRWRRLGPSLLYAATLFACGAVYFYADYRSFDARLARAERAKLYGRGERAVEEYRAALRVREDARTRQLLGLELLRAGRAAEALDELRAAARAAEPDEELPFHTAAALEALGRRGEAAAEYRRFLAGRLCTQPSHRPECEAARARLGESGP